MSLYHFRSYYIMGKNIPRILLNALLVAHYLYIIYFVNSLKIPGHRHNAFGGQWKFLTYWNLWLQLIYFLVGLCTELFGTDSNKATPSRLQKMRDFMFGSLAFPLGIFVSIIFWALYALDRNLVFPPKMDEFYPLWSNHMLHTTCLVAQLIEMISTPHDYPSRTKGMLTSMGFAMVYLGWVLIIAYKANIWVYGVLQKLPAMGRIMFIAGCCILFGIMFIGGEALNSKIWSTKTRATKSHKQESNGNEDSAPVPTHAYNTRSRKKVARVD